jgi:hypothetical protein
MICGRARRKACGLHESSLLLACILPTSGCPPCSHPSARNAGAGRAKNSDSFSRRDPLLLLRQPQPAYQRLPAQGFVHAPQVGRRYPCPAEARKRYQTNRWQQLLLVHDAHLGLHRRWLHRWLLGWAGSIASQCRWCSGTPVKGRQPQARQAIIPRPGPVHGNLRCWPTCSAATASDTRRRACRVETSSDKATIMRADAQSQLSC